MPVLVAAVLSVTWIWPLSPPHVVSRPFQPPPTAYGAGHRGVDLVGATGDPVRAAGAGVVSVAGPLAGRGIVVVAHGGLRTTYEPVTASVQVGETVDAGDVLGQLEAGHAGCPVAACLHWGLRRGEDYLDPLTLVGRGRVRLLPLGTHRPAVQAAAPREPLPAARAARPSSEPARGSGAATAVLAQSAAAVAAGVWLLRRRRPH